MPCRDYAYEDEQSRRTVTETVYRDNPETVKRVHKMSAMLCALLRSIESNRGAVEANTLISRSKYPKDLKAWWIQHQKDDKKATLKKKK